MDFRARDALARSVAAANTEAFVEALVERSGGGSLNASDRPSISTTPRARRRADDDDDSWEAGRNERSRSASARSTSTAPRQAWRTLARTATAWNASAEVVASRSH